MLNATFVSCGCEEVDPVGSAYRGDELGVCTAPGRRGCLNGRHSVIVFSEFTGGGLHNQTTTTHSERTAVCEIPWVFCTVRQWTRVFQITVTPADSDTISGCTTHGGPCLDVRRPARQPALART